MSRVDPGPCAICGAAHAACTEHTGPLTIAQTPSRDAEFNPPRLVAEVVQETLPEGQVTTGTFRGKKKG